MADQEREKVVQEAQSQGQVRQLPILPLRDAVAYPLAVMPIVVGRPRSMRMVNAVLRQEERVIGLLTVTNPDVEEAGPNDVYRVGTMARIVRYVRAPDDTVHLVVQGQERFRVLRFVQEEPYIVAEVELIPEVEDADPVMLRALMRSLAELFQRLAELSSHLPDELATVAANLDDPRQLLYLVASNVRISLADRQKLLEMDSLKEKLEWLIRYLTQEVEVQELGRKIREQAQSEMEKAQREYFLRQQLKAIQEELGETDEQSKEIAELEEQIAKAGMPPEVEKEARRELDRLRKLPPAAAEYSVIRTYLDWLIHMPWQVMTEDNLDVERARQVLDEDHYDLDKVKERILEFIAVRKLKQERDPESLGRSPILCFVGPPGVGKTSLGRSIARALGRKFTRMSLGGVRDEAEIRGHRRTYIGAMPGRIIQAIRRAGTRNPVIMLDEVDKLGTDFRGDPAAALLEVLDPEQNKEFRDHYLDVPFDLSQVLFITTANILETIPPPLLDRMEVIRIPGYTEQDKLQIARRYLLPRQIKENGLQEGELTVEDEAILEVIRRYTREAGVRNLERELGKICRKAAIRIASGEATQIHVKAEDLPEFLGQPRYRYGVAHRVVTPGVATGLVWTPVGGDIIFIEATSMPGKGNLILTGQLGAVMQESAKAALSYVRSKAERLGIDPEVFQKFDIHLHVPEGAIPKDGPSAGITMATALASLLTGRKVREDVAMTGEITLRGVVLPIGGLKEKVLAAHRAGIKKVILPKENEGELQEVLKELPEEVGEELEFILVEWVDEVFEAALEPAPEAEAPEEAPQEEAVEAN